MLEQVLMYLNNWFVVPDGIHAEKFSIKDGSITLPFLLSGQYFRICGSVLNDGLHKYPATDLQDEDFDGLIWALTVPPAVVLLSDDIEAWTEKHKPSAYTSESFGGYSRTVATGKNGTPAGWQDVFAEQLAPYRKIRENAPVRGLQPLKPYYRPFNPDYPWRW